MKRKRRLAALAPDQKAQTRVFFVIGDEPAPPLPPGEREEDRIVFRTIYEPKPEPTRWWVQ